MEHKKLPNVMRGIITINTPDGNEDFRVILSDVKDFEVRVKTHEKELNDRIEDIKDLIPINYWYGRPVWVTFKSKMADEDGI